MVAIKDFISSKNNLLETINIFFIIILICALVIVIVLFTHALLELFILFIISVMYIVTIVIIIKILSSIKNPARLAYFMDCLGRGLAIALLSIAVIALNIDILMFIGNLLPQGTSSQSDIIALPNIALGHILTFLIHPPVILILLGSAGFNVFCCIVVQLVILFARIHLRAYLATPSPDLAAKRLLDIASSSSQLPQIRRIAIKELRLYELPSGSVDILENLTTSGDFAWLKSSFWSSMNNLNLQRELERTVYELRSRNREKDRRW